MPGSMKLPSRRAALGGLAGLLAAPGIVRAEPDWPKGPITWLNPFAPGGAIDIFGRPLAAQVGEQIGRQIVVDNKAGAGGTVGASIASKMKADGSAFFIGAVHHTIAPSIYKHLDYDLEKSFTPIIMHAVVPQVISINPQRVPVKDHAEFLAYVKANPNKVNFASPGAGTAHHLAGELYKLETGAPLVHVPYKGAGPAMQDLVAGNVDMMFDGMGTSAQYLRSGKLRGLATATDKRLSEFPDIPTGAEVGVPKWIVSSWYGLWAVAGTPAPLVGRMYDECVKALATDKLKTVWKNQIARVGPYTPTAFAERIHVEIARWAKVVVAAGVKID